MELELSPLTSTSPPQVAFYTIDSETDTDEDVVVEKEAKPEDAGVKELPRAAEQLPESPGFTRPSPVDIRTRQSLKNLLPRTT